MVLEIDARIFTKLLIKFHKYSERNLISFTFDLP